MVKTDFKVRLEKRKTSITGIKIKNAPYMGAFFIDKELN
jgi:hypothetical protein